MPLINCEIELDFSWLKDCLIPEIPRIPGIAGNTAIKANGATFQINNFKLYVPVTALSNDYNFKFLENTK